jgi:hypothetical protein
MLLALLGGTLALVRDSGPGCSLLQEPPDYETYCPSEFDAAVSCATHVVCPITTECVPAARLVRLEQEGGRHCYDGPALGNWIRIQERSGQAPRSPLTREKLHNEDLARLRAAGFLPSAARPNDMPGRSVDEEWRVGGDHPYDADQIAYPELVGRPRHHLLQRLRAAGRSVLSAPLALRSWHSRAPDRNCFQCGTLTDRCLLDPYSDALIYGNAFRALTFSSNINVMGNDTSYSERAEALEDDVYTCQHVLGSSRDRNHPIDVGVAGCYPFYVECPVLEADRPHLHLDVLQRMAPGKFRRAAGTGLWFSHLHDGEFGAYQRTYPLNIDELYRHLASGEPASLP